MSEQPQQYPRVRPPGKRSAEQEQASASQTAAETIAAAAPHFEEDVSAAIEQGKKFPCSACGAKMNFNPKDGNLKCGYCGHQQEIPKSENDVKELCFETYFKQGELVEEVIQGAEMETRCPGCGAMVMMPTHVKSDFCPFCSTQLTNPLVVAKPLMAPGGILPFKVDKGEATTLFRGWVSSRWFAPNALKNVTKLDQLQGIYAPFWTYDSSTFTFYTGQRGEHYYVTVGTGENRRRQRRTRWYNVSGQIFRFFDDVPVCASRTVPQDFMEKLEPWDMPAVVPFNKDFLSGFKTERYQISTREGFDLAREKMNKEIQQLIYRDIGGDEQRITSTKTQFDAVTFKYLMMPLWIAAYKYKNKGYQVYINARTGEMHGTRPYSIVKITLAVMAVVILILLIVLFASKNS
ncbi:MAG: hypothetical protein ACFCU1_13595 [Sumerlaeia bacterium]